MGFHPVALIDSTGFIHYTDKIDWGQEHSFVMVWEDPKKHKPIDLSWLQSSSPEVYREVIAHNGYKVDTENLSNRTVIDIGANVGMFSILASNLGAKSVIAVEPVTDTFGTLTTNVQQANFTNIKLLKNVVSDRTGDIAKIGVTQKSGHNSLYNLSEQVESVETISINDLIIQTKANNIFLKIDCEGAEYDILLGASQEAMDNVTDVVIEIHADTHPVYKGNEILESKLSAFGFTMVEKIQMFGWNLDPTGQVIKETVKPIPCCVEFWKK